MPHVQLPPPLRNILRLLLKIAAWTLGGMVLVFLILYFVIQIPSVQQRGIDEATAFVREQTGTDVQVERLTVDFWHTLVIEGVYLEDERQDTLLHVGRLGVNLGLLHLLRQEVFVDEIFLTDVTARLQRQDSVYNFQFLIDAFTSADSAAVDTVAEARADTASGEISWKVGFERIRLSNIDARVDDQTSGFLAELRLGEFTIDNDQLDLNAQRLHLDEIALEETFVGYQIFKPAPPDTAPSEPLSFPDLGWELTLDDFTLEEIEVLFRDHTQAPADSGAIDYAHLRLRDLALHIAEIELTPARIAAKLQTLRLRDRSGLQVNDLDGQLSWTPREILVENFELALPESRIRNRSTLRYPDLSALENFDARLQLTTDLSGTSLAFREVVRFVPDLRQTINADSSFALRVDGRISGTPAKLRGEQLRIRSGQRTGLAANFTVSRLMQPDSMQIDLRLDSLTTRSTELAQLLTLALPPEVMPFGDVRYQATYRGGVYGGDFQGELRSNAGGLTHDLFADLDSGYTNGRYRGELALQQLDLGAILANDSLGPLTFEATFDGRGLALADLDTRLDAVVREATFNGYAYQDLEIHGQVEQQSFRGGIDLRDPNLRLDFDGEVNLNDSLPRLRFQAALDTINLKNLRLSENELALSTDLKADLVGDNVDNLLGTFDLQNLNLSHNQRHYHEDTLRLIAANQGQQRQLMLRSQIARLDLKGDFQVDLLSTAMLDLVDSYFPVKNAVPDSLTPPQDSIARPQDLALTLELSRPNRLIRLFEPDLTEFDTLALQLNFDSEGRQLSGGLMLPSFVYGGLRSDSVQVNWANNAEQLTLTVRMDSFRSGDLSPLNPSVALRLGQKALGFDVAVARDTLPRLLGLAGRMTRQGEAYRLALADSFFLNHQRWNLDPANEILLDTNRTSIQHLTLSREQQRLAIDGNTLDSLRIAFQGFLLKPLFEIAEFTDYDLRGQIDGQANLIGLDTGGYYTADLTIGQIELNEERIGDWEIQAGVTPDGERVTIESRMRGNTQFAIAGSYGLSNEQIDLNLDLEQIQLKLLRPFTEGVLSRSSGKLVGKIDITGSANQPDIDGYVALQEAASRIDYLGVYYQFPDERIALSPTEIRFDDFTLTDTLDREAVLDGVITHEYFDNLRLNLDFSTDAFSFLDTKAGDNEMFYGSMLLDLTARITGTLEDTKVAAEARTLPGTNLTVLTPEDEEAVIQEDYVLFVKPTQFGKQLDADSVESQPRYRAQVEGLTLDLRLEVTPETKLTYVIDPLTGDKVNLQGEALLTMGINPAGDVSLLGSYEIKKGDYRFSYEGIVTKEFEVKPGSRIVFPGDIYEGTMDLTAIYTARTATYDLIRNELADPNGAVAQEAKRRTDVQVLMNIKGEFFSPELSFDVQVPEQEQGSVVSSAVSRKLAQLRQNESELNQQVFGLLLLGGFVGTGSSGGGTGLEGVAVSSVSSFLNSQLNTLADKYVQGVQVDINLESYQSSYDEQNTLSQLEVGLSRQLFNERLTVSVGTEIGVESSSLSNADDSELTQITGNFVLRYRLTEDGRYNLRVFRKSDADDPLSGAGNAAVKTGAGASFRRSFE